MDAIKQIIDTEQAARDSLARAIKETEQMVLDAETKGKALLSHAREAAEQEVAIFMQEAEKAGYQRREEILLHAENQCAVLRAHGNKKRNVAVDRIVERIVKG